MDDTKFNERCGVAVVERASTPARGGRIGLVDDCLDNFHAQVYQQILRGPLASRGFTIAGATAWQTEASRGWARAHRIPYFDSVDDLAPHVDHFAILAPSRPELHLEMCQAVFPHGKTTFVDKTFAPNLAIAQEIFSLADRYGVAVQSTSALRTTEVQRRCRELTAPLHAMSVWAGGSSWEEYGVHPVELVVSCLGPRITDILPTGTKGHPLVLLLYEDGRRATIDFNAHNHVPFQAALTTSEGTEFWTIDGERLFENAAALILDFFQAGRALIDREETLTVLRVLDAVRESLSRIGESSPRPEFPFCEPASSD